MQPLNDFRDVVLKVAVRDFGPHYLFKEIYAEAVDVCDRAVVFFNHQDEFTIATIILAAPYEDSFSRTFPGCTRKAREDPDNRKFANMTALCRAVRLFLNVRIAEIKREEKLSKQAVKSS